MNDKAWKWIKAAGVLGLISLAGCQDSGRGGVAVQGTVMLDGQPLAAGSIVFSPLEEMPGHRAATEIVDGKYVMKAKLGPVPGHYRVKIYADDPSDVAWDDPQAFAASKLRFPPRNPVAPQFNEQSKLTRVIQGQEPHQFDFEVTSLSRK